MKSESDNGGGVGDDAASSRYSSCGESEFERYCSANSAMGTPSVCSSITVFNDLSELDFGGSSSGSLGLGFVAEGGGLEGFSLGGERIERNREEMKRLSDERTTTSANYGSSWFVLYGNESNEISFLGFNNGLMSWNKAENESVPLKGLLEFDNGGSEKGDCSDGGEMLGKGEGFEPIEPISGRGVESSDPSDGREKEMEGPEDGALSCDEDEHSEGEDSMYNYSSDDEDKKVGIGRYRNEGYRVEAKSRDENLLLIISSVAFELEGWDDFVEESGGLAMPLDSSTIGVFEKREVQSIEAKREVSDLIPVNSVKHVANVPVSSNHRVEVVEELDDIVDKSVAQAGFMDFGEPPEVEDVKDIPIASCQVQGVHDVIEFTKISFSTPVTKQVEDLEKEDTRQIPYTKNYDRGGDGLVDCPETDSLDNVTNIELDPLAEEFPKKIISEKRNDGLPHGHQNMHTEVTVNIGNSQDYAKPNVKLDRFDDSPTNPVSSSSKASSRNMKLNMLEDSRKKTESSTLKNTSKSLSVSDVHGKHPMPVKTEARELNEFYDEVVLEMEEILLASNESPGGRFPHGNRALQSQLSLPIRDGGASASTSGTDENYPFVHQPLRIDGVEVVGARQQKGDVSLGERLVGVKEYTLYKIRVWSGKDQWEVERRYRDFFTLYSRLKTLFASQCCVLPSPWATVEKESRKIFGNSSPNVVAERSVLIQECLHSILRPRFFSTSSSALIWFLYPRDSVPGSPASNTTVSQSVYLGNRENISTLGKTISLIVEIQPYKSVKQILESQHYTCAGCYKHFDDGKTLMRDFAQTFGWGKPRLCEYTSQLFCSSCHTNETAVLPARVLHNWDFAPYPVSQLAKSFLDSIHDQPMLCVSAVNPFLFSKVPTLLHVMGVRRKIGSILAYVRCSFRGSINRGLGSRKYLLESNDFFALRDLIDLSKGAFAVLPVMVETVLKKIVEHITEQCLVCCNIGVPCGARQACNDPSSLIFPFQDGNVEKCQSCESEFHKSLL